MPNLGFRIAPMPARLATSSWWVPAAWSRCRRLDRLLKQRGYDF